MREKNVVSPEMCKFYEKKSAISVKYYLCKMYRKLEGNMCILRVSITYILYTLR